MACVPLPPSLPLDAVWRLGAFSQVLLQKAVCSAFGARACVLCPGADAALGAALLHLKDAQTPRVQAPQADAPGTAALDTLGMCGCDMYSGLCSCSVPPIFLYCAIYASPEQSGAPEYKAAVWIFLMRRSHSMSFTRAQGIP